jgi:hypothetical protein
MVSHENFNLSANEGFVIFLISKLITWFIGGFTYLLNESEHKHWIWDLKGEVHSIWDLGISSLQKCKDNGFFEIGRGTTVFGQVQKFLIF